MASDFGSSEESDDPLKSREFVALQRSGLIDELNRMAQSLPAMIRLGIFLAAVLTLLPASAQTNLQPREMSLEDCIETALHHNLDVQIKRLNPELSHFTLEAAYGAYEPAFAGGAEHDYTRQPGSVDANGRIIPGAEIESERY